MFTLNSCTVSLPDGSKLKRQKVVISDNILTSYEKRTGKVRVSMTIDDYDVQSKNRVLINTSEGPILLEKSGCGCGR